MLALARKVNQSIIIGNDIEITLLEIKGDQVKIGINAPKSVPLLTLLLSLMSSSTGLGVSF